MDSGNTVQNSSFCISLMAVHCLNVRSSHVPGQVIRSCELLMLQIQYTVLFWCSIPWIGPLWQSDYSQYFAKSFLICWWGPLTPSLDLRDLPPQFSLLWNSHLIPVLSEKGSNFSPQFYHVPLKHPCNSHFSNSEHKKHTAVKMNRGWGQLFFMGCRNQMEIPVALLRPLNMNFHVPS